MNNCDEVQAMVIDIGNTFTKLTMCGEDKPFATHSNLRPTQPISQPYLDFENLNLEAYSDTPFTPNVTKDVVEDMEWQWAQVKHMVQRNNNAEFLAELPVIITEPPVSRFDYIAADHLHSAFLHTHSKDLSRQRNKMVEYAFDTLNSPAVLLLNQASLCGFSLGKTSGFVVEASGNRTVYSAIHDGYLLRRNTIVDYVGMNNIIDIILEYEDNNLGGSDNNSKYYPNALFEETYDVLGNVVNKQRNLSEFNLDNLNYLRREHFRSIYFKHFTFDYYSDETNTITLPDETTLTLGQEKNILPKCLFSSRDKMNDQLKMLKYSPAGSNVDLFPAFTKFTNDRCSIDVNMANLMQNLDIDLKKDLANNLVLVGSHSILKNMQDYLIKFYQQSLNLQGLKPKLACPVHNVEKRHASSLGGSIVGNLCVFQKEWLSWEEYMEMGEGWIDRKFKY